MTASPAALPRRTRLLAAAIGVAAASLMALGAGNAMADDGATTGSAGGASSVSDGSGAPADGSGSSGGAEKSSGTDSTTGAGAESGGSTDSTGAPEVDSSQTGTDTSGASADSPSDGTLSAPASPPPDEPAAGSPAPDSSTSRAGAPIDDTDAPTALPADPATGTGSTDPAASPGSAGPTTSASTPDSSATPSTPDDTTRTPTTEMTAVEQVTTSPADSTESDPSAAPVDTPVLRAATDLVDPSTGASLAGTDSSVPASLIAVLQNLTLGASTSTTRVAASATTSSDDWWSSLIPTIALPPTTWDPDSQAWEDQWEAFASSIVVWVPGLGTAVNYVSLGIDSYQLVTAVQARDTAGVSDEVGDLSGDLARLTFGPVVGGVIQILVVDYAANTVAAWIIDVTDTDSVAVTAA
ncbi:hypothetical protein ACWDTI_13170 [Gordonia sp. NPDC003424]